MGDNRNHRGESKTRLYRIWIDRKSRCLNPNSCNYRHYGERGISICEEWVNDYKAFKNWALANGYSDSLTIDRINNDGNYEPSNCRWATKSIQGMSMRHKNTRGYVGISKISNGDAWYGRVKVNGKCYYTGTSKNIHEAAKMRNDFIMQNNFPNKLNEVLT